ncbi:MAG TPA: acyloxyacyl hydrolase [Steroidobacteraceae bacterium]|nr:acyloxyacyl hydrolase [Steroidobacteraceae bacterium]
MNRNKNSKRQMDLRRRALGTLLTLFLMGTAVASRAGFLAELALTPHLVEMALLDDRLLTEIPAPQALALDSRHSGDRSGAFSFCRDCEFHLGVGGTYNSIEATRGVVIPMTVAWNRSRWEFGLFHFSEQYSSDNPQRVDQVVAQPYWGASLSRRFQLFERGPLRAIFGFGVSYRTETDVLSATHWNFASQFGLRFQSPQFPAVFELSARHWSNGGVRHPNRGQDFTILTVRFDR